MARVGTSAIKMRRKAFATDASRPMREKEASCWALVWNWILKFYKILVKRVHRDRSILIYLLEVLQVPGMVLSGPVAGKICGGDMRDGFGVNAYYLWWSKVLAEMKIHRYEHIHTLRLSSSSWLGVTIFKGDTHIMAGRLRYESSSNFFDASEAESDRYELSTTSPFTSASSDVILLVRIFNRSAS